MSSITIHALDSSLDLRLADDYREFCGLWSTGELAAFNTTQTENSSIDAHFNEIDGLLRVSGLE